MSVHKNNKFSNNIIDAYMYKLLLFPLEYMVRLDSVLIFCASVLDRKNRKYYYEHDDDDDDKSRFF